MKAVVMTEPRANSLELRNVSVPVPKEDEVLVKVSAAAICGTDVHIRAWNEWTQKRMTPPTVIGHEFVGIVVETGKNVRGIEADDIVVPESHIPCEVCPDCRAGNRHVCRRTGLMGITRDGGFAEYVSVPSRILYKVPKDMDVSYKTLSILEPFGQAVHAVMDYPVCGKVIAVAGCGPIGQMAVKVARLMGAQKIIAIEINPVRGQQALNEGADILINPAETDPVDEIMSITGNVGVDIAIELSGNVVAGEQATRYIRSEGKLVVAGLPDKPFSFNMSEFAYKGGTIHGAPARLLYQTWEDIDSLLKQGLRLDEFVTHELPLEKFNEGIDMMESGTCSKCLLIP